MITSEESFERKYPAYQRTIVPEDSSTGTPMYGELKNPAFIPNRSNSFASTASSHAAPISASCSSSLSSGAANPKRGAPIGYLVRVMAFTSPRAGFAGSKSPSKKYPNRRSSAAKPRTVASMSATNSPRPSGTRTNVPFASVATLGKKWRTGVTRGAHPTATREAASSASSSSIAAYSSWQTSS